MDTKFFRSRFSGELKQEWKDIIKSLGVNVYDVMVPCERAVVLGGMWENPSAFQDIDTFVFYLKRMDGSFRAWMDGVHVDVLRIYYDKMFNLSGMDSSQAATYIRKTLEGK